MNKIHEDFDVNKFIDENWEKIKEVAKKLEKLLEEEEEGIYIIYDIED